MMREGVNEAHFNPLHSHSWGESGQGSQVKSEQEKPNEDGSGKRYWGSQLQRSTSKKLMKSYNVFMKGKKKNVSFQEDLLRKSIRSEGSPLTPHSQVSQQTPRSSIPNWLLLIFLVNAEFAIITSISGFTFILSLWALHLRFLLFLFFPSPPLDYIVFQDNESDESFSTHREVLAPLFTSVTFSAAVASDWPCWWPLCLLPW